MRAEPNNFLLVRADASAAIGTGHVMRCLAVAQAWRRAGGRVLLVQAEGLESLERRWTEIGAEVTTICATVGSEADVLATLAHAEKAGAEWILADGYRLGVEWQRSVRAAGRRLMLVDDYGHGGTYSAEVVLNQNLSASASLYPRCDENVRLLLGARYVLLREEFLGWRHWRREHPERAAKILVTLGGSDPDNVTGRVLRGLVTLGGVEILAVVGSGNPHLAELRALVSSALGRVKFVVDATNMPELMAWADIAVSAAGSTSWELAFIGLPAVQLVVADNQAGIAAALAAGGITISLGDFREVTPEQIAAAVVALSADGARRREMGARGRALIDGHGAARVTAALGRKLQVTVVSDAGSWLNASIPQLVAAWESAGHVVSWIHDPGELGTGDLAFFLSLSRIVPAEALTRHAHNLVVHESALPAGRGWSPLTWQVLEGKNEIPVTLFEAEAGVDSGEIYAQTEIRLKGDELVDELRAAQVSATFDLCRKFVADYPYGLANARAQSGEPTCYPRRRPADSRLDPDKTLRELFNQLRVADDARYPAFFEMAGRRFEIRLAGVDTTAVARTV